MWWSLNASVTMINRQKNQYSFSLNIGWSWRGEWPRQHTSWDSGGREEFTSHWWSQAVSCFSRAWKSNCDSFSRKNANLWDPRQDLFWSVGFGPPNSARPDLVRLQTWRVAWLVQDPFWRCVVSCQVDESVIVWCLTLFSKMTYWLLMQVIVRQ